MSSNLKVNTILPSVGTAIGIGTAGGSVSITSDTITASTGGSERVRIKSDGKIGIGTAAPLQRLHIRGEGEGDHLLYLQAGDTICDIIQSDNGGSTRLRSANGSFYVWTGGDGNSSTGANGSPAIHVNTSLETKFYNTIKVVDKIEHDADSDTALRFPAADTFTVETAGSERLRITSAGDIVIGTDNRGISFANSSSSPDADSTSSTRVITDYDEGTCDWELHRSDGLTTGSNNATTKVTYTKIGNRVFIAGYVYTASTGSSTSVTAILTDASGNTASLPYTPNHHGILPICHTRTISEYERMSVAFESGSKTVYVHADEGYNSYIPNTNNVNIGSPQTHLNIAFTGSYTTDE